ncbi:conjugative transposon protein TraN [Dyadobacter sp. 3J3]|uniref:conjugative transposon protein TraN n=1 Tax=Dyadobacter sp. 3J3 TaxID=2606600 RepID=UPI0013582AA1|nr:conjugative transposon protein TraN [Dyadobacter sp. 3J3]
MKALSNIAAAIILLILISGSASFAQDGELYGISPYPLEITDQKTTNIIFPYDIVSVDKGSRWILAQKAKGLSNILQLKASAAGFAQSNLTVVTRDGKLYSFLVDYSPEPLQLNIGFSASQTNNQGAILKDSYNQAQIQADAASISTLPTGLHGISDKSGQLKMQLLGIYIHDHIMYYKLRLINKSPIPYDIESIRFFVGDSKQAKRGAVQQLEIQPVQIYNDSTRIEPGSAVVKVYALAKMTLEGTQKLHIKMSEQNGGRHPHLQISSKTLLKASSI